MSPKTTPAPRRAPASRPASPVVAPADVAVDAVAMAVVGDIHRVAGAVRNRMERGALKADGLSWTGYAVLCALMASGSLETRRLAEVCGVSKGTLTGVLTTLEGRGLVARGPHDSDGRLVVVALTRAGRTLIRRVLPRVNRAETEVAAVLSERERGQLAGLLRKLAAHLDGE